FLLPPPAPTARSPLSLHDALPICLTIQRRIVGPVRLLAGAAVVRTDFRALPGDNIFRRDLASGVVDPATVPFTDKVGRVGIVLEDRKSTRLNSSHEWISYAVFCLK